jgi:predicted CXXCH cytochrome family protein
MIVFLNLNFSYKSDISPEIRNSPLDNCKECHSDLTEYRNMHPIMEEGCETCHQPTGDEHPIEGGFRLTETMPDLCYMCHDNFEKENLHYPAAEGECLSCHSPHGSENSSLLLAPVNKVCAECHDAGVPDNFTVHYPFTESSCTDCHDPHQSDNNGLLKSALPSLCFECHENEVEMEGRESLHYPYGEETCTTCHKPHISEQPKLLAQPLPDLCFNCHEESTSAYPHSPVKDGKCMSCHKPHASTQGSLLIAENKEVCLNCHSKTYRTDSTLVNNIGQLISKSTYVHSAIEMDGCATCHAGHGTENASLLRKKYPAGFYTEAKAENFALCFDCHDGTILEEDVNVSGTNFRNGSQNLHYVHINGDKGRSCSMCHNVHASSNEHLIKETATYGKWNMKMNYKVLENGGSCFPGCHGELKYDRSLE